MARKEVRRYHNAGMTLYIVKDRTFGPPWIITRRIICETYETYYVQEDYREVDYPINGVFLFRTFEEAKTYLLKCINDTKDRYLAQSVEFSNRATHFNKTYDRITDMDTEEEMLAAGFLNPKEPPEDVKD